MVDDGLSKNPAQRKRSSRQDSCINNVKLNKRSIRTPVETNTSTYTKNKPNERFQRGSLENVSINPWGTDIIHLDGQSSLRRTRSLAITRDDIFTNNNFDITTNSTNTNTYSNSKPRRSQLIPRAKLIDRSREHRYVSKAPSVENLPNDNYPQQRTLTKKQYSDSNSQSLDNSTRNRASRQQSELQQSDYSSINNLAGPKFLIGAASPPQTSQSDQQLDSLETNYNGLIHNTTFRVSYEDLPGLSLPNYYPDSKYDNDTDNTDIISITDNLSTASSKKYSSCDNISSGKWTINESEKSIPYDENIVLSSNKALYDLPENHHYAKPTKTIRGPTPYNREQNNQTFYRRSYSSDSSGEDKFKEPQQQNNENIYESNTNLDKIENIAKIIVEEEKIDENKSVINDNNDELKIEEDIFEPSKEIQKNENNEQYKTIVTVEHESKNEIDLEVENEETDEEKNKHSHNYLKEFLESQKGNKRPLQNFLSKKFSNLSRRNSKDINSNLTDNRFHSLPDITASKNLRKCEKIDRKLRKLEKTNLTKKSPTTDNINNIGENRFIVNIGKHFDITANTTVPVDFELKIAKIPRKAKLKKTGKNKTEEQFLQAVKNLKQTLNNNNNCEEEENYNNKPEIIGVKTKQTEQTDKEVQEITMNLNEEKTSKICNKEYQEKLGTMRTYWDKLMNINSQPNIEKNNDDNPHKCKIVDVQTKIDDVKKKFEPEEPKEPEKPNKVQIAKQLFEKPKPVEKTEKISPFIKETCNYFENSRDNQFESLNPNIVEIITKDENNKRGENATVIKSQQNEPEFDHVRYRVVKSDLFQKKIFAQCEKESQFDGLMQYLQDYSFQELLRDNNIVIIEPIRTKIPHETRCCSTSSTTTKNITPLLHRQNGSKSNNNTKSIDETNANLKRHFFYHPIRVNKEVNDDELPNPDTVKQVRQFFETGVDNTSLKRSQSSQDFDNITTKPTKSIIKTHQKSFDPDKDHCSATDSNSNQSDFDSQENLYESITELCCEQQYVSEEILEKIREYGSTVTYYGGRVVKKELAQPTFTKAIMDEIKNQEKQHRIIECNCDKDTYQGVKFKLVKSNSCNSRLELVGTSNLQQSKEKYFKNKQKQIKQQNLLKKVREDDIEYDNKDNYTANDKNTINENIKKMDEEQQYQPPRIIAEERKMTQWGDVKKDKKTYNGINFNNTKPKINNYDYHNYDNVKGKNKKLDEMEFEPYEIA